MKTFQINLEVKAEVDATFWETDRTYDTVILAQIIRDHLYELDDIKVETVDVEEV